MTTTFKRAALIDAAKQAIAAKQEVIDKWETDAEVARTKHLHRWFTEERPKLKAARDALSKALKGGKPITAEQVGSVDRLFYSELSDYQVSRTIGYPGNETRQNVVRAITSYQGVLALLESMEGETISVSQVKQLGITKINELFHIAAQKGGTVEKTVI